MKNKRPRLSNGLIKSINKGQFIYTCNTYPGSSGGVIVNQNTNCIIGMHRGECVEANKKNKNKKINLNIGIFMRSITDDINSNNSNLEKYIENNKDNEEKEEINIENNNDIENKKSSNNNIGKFKIDEADKTYKICLGGFSGSGKTCFAYRIQNDKFDDCTGTAGMSAWFQVKKKIINNLKIIFNIWDIPGWRKRPGMVKFYLEGSDGVILLFSIIERNSFLALDECYELIEKAISDLSNFPILLIGTNCDIKNEREIKCKEAIDYAKRRNFIGYYEISLKTGKNVFDSIDFLENCIYQININNKKIKDIKFKEVLY
jgi:small GTP-binding protein